MTHVPSESDERTINNDVRHQYRVLIEDEKAIKDAGVAFLRALDMNCPPGRELSLAKTRTEEAVMWAVRGLTQGLSP